MDIAVDGGQTGLRIGLAGEGRLLRTHEVAGLSYAAGSPVDVVTSRVLEAWRGLDPPKTRLGSLCLGLTSLLGTVAAHEELARRLLDAIPARRVLVTGDVVTAHAGAFQGRPGVVLAAGTGAVALGVGACGATRQVDGWGFLLGDAGSGLWIGSRGLEAAYRGYDGRLAPGPLTARAHEVLGDLGRLPERLYLADDAVARVAGFAVHVLELAAVDETALAIVEAAGHELADSVAAAACCFSGTAQVPVSWTGRLLRDPILRAAFEGRLGTRLPQARIAPPAGDGLTGAAVIAATAGLGRYQTLVRKFER
ncbi:N-acetylglucosamine kinase [Rhizohabitans arisaemae]|uniref:N-acetylglucosamine kinase n=1 Tax=Rhizohabitans arisaemae TaxID=2720610 RepID=UPI0024B1BF9E|nr:BadF/BadG/BcrA/BcrD ATPase family protein [Rhizohabitans arisaemae]